MDEKRGSRISQAHTNDPLKDGRLPEASKTLNQQFTKARDMQREQAAKRQSPSMSFGKTVQLDGREAKIDAATRNARAQFDRAKSPQIDQRTAGQPNRPGSQMVQRDQPKPVLAPSAAMRAGSDRQSYNDRLDAERKDKAIQINQSLKARNNGAKNIELENGRNKNNDDRSR